MNKLLPRLVLLLLAVAFGAMVYIGYLRLFPFNPADFNNQPFPVSSDTELDKNGRLISKSVQAGQLMIYQIDYCRHTNVDSHFTRTLIGPTLVTIADSTSTVAPGCYSTLVTNTVVPSYVEPGEYYLKINVCFKVNPLQEVCEDVKTENFEVKPPKRDKDGNIIALPEAIINQFSSQQPVQNPRRKMSPIPPISPSPKPLLDIQVSPPPPPIKVLPDTTPHIQIKIDQTGSKLYRYDGSTLWNLCDGVLCR